jgi:hypothetical protein
MTADNRMRTLGRVMEVGGYLALMLCLIHAAIHLAHRVSAGPVGAEGGLGMLNALFLGFVDAMPLLFLINGLAAMAALGAAYGRGEMFSAKNAKRIRSFGEALAWAAAAVIVIQPTLLDWISGVSRGIDFNIDAAGLALAAGGIFTTAMAYAMQRAHALQAEHDSFV